MYAIIINPHVYNRLGVLFKRKFKIICQGYNPITNYSYTLLETNKGNIWYNNTDIKIMEVNNE